MRNKNRSITYLALTVIFIAGILVFSVPSIIDTGISKRTLVDLAHTIGISLVVAPISIAVTLYFSGVNFDEKLDRILHNLPSSEDHFDSMGITHIYKSRDVATSDFLKLCKHAEEIDVMGICIPQLIVKYEDFEMWASEKSVRILVLDEKSDLFSSCISWFFKHAEPEKEATGKSSVAQFTRLTAHGGEVKKYENWPMASLMRADDVIFYTPYIYKRRAQDSPTIKIVNATDTWLYEIYHQAFEEKFNEAKPAKFA